MPSYTTARKRAVANRIVRDTESPNEQMLREIERERERMEASRAWMKAYLAKPENGDERDDEVPPPESEVRGAGDHRS